MEQRIRVWSCLLHYSWVYTYIRDIRGFNAVFIIDSMYKNRRKGDRTSVLNQSSEVGQNLTIRYSQYTMMRSINIYSKLVILCSLFTLIGLSVLRFVDQPIFFEYFIFISIEIASYTFKLNYIPNTKGEEGSMRQNGTSLEIDRRVGNESLDNKNNNNDGYEKREGRDAKEMDVSDVNLLVNDDPSLICIQPKDVDGECNDNNDGHIVINGEIIEDPEIPPHCKSPLEFLLYSMKHMIGRYSGLEATD